MRVLSQLYRKSHSYSIILIALLPPEFAVSKRHGRLVRSLSANTRVYFHGFPSGWLFLFAVLMAAGLLFCMVFFVCRNPRPAIPGLALTLPQIIMFSDLECDYINPIDLCNKLGN